MHKYSVWRSMARGLGWGVLAAVLNAVVAPMLYEIGVFVDALLDGDHWNGLSGGVAPIIWLCISVLVMILFSIPSMIGGAVLGLILHYRLLSNSRLERPGMWWGMGVGILVAWVGLGGLSLMGFQEGIRGGSYDGVFAALTTIWGLIVGGWTGHRINHACFRGKSLT